jgi:hypothetical protein
MLHGLFLKASKGSSGNSAIILGEVGSNVSLR